MTLPSFAPLETEHPVTTGGALQSSVKMAYFTDMETVKGVLQFEQNHSAPMVQWWFRTSQNKKTPTRKSTYKMHK
jgi:hypothetical protein